LGGLAPFGVADGVQAAVGGDAVEPRTQRRTTCEAAQAVPGRDQRLLEEVLGISQRAEHPVTVQVQLARVRTGELAEGLIIPRLSSLEEGTAHRHIVTRQSPADRESHERIFPWTVPLR